MNQIKIMTIQIVKNGRPIMFDSSDWSIIHPYKWYVEPHGYACALRKDKKQVKMHRLLLGITDSKLHGDHINHIRADNRRCNIRIATPLENARNAKASGECKYLGVTYQNCTYNGKKGTYTYRYLKAKIRVDNRLIHLGTFTDEVEAAKAYNEAAIKYFGEFANLNKL